MANNVQFSIAVHLLAGVACGCNQKGVTSGYLAESINTSPSFVRRTLAKLSKAGLVRTATGKAGACWLGRDAHDITLLDVYHAVDAPKAFAIHTYSEKKSCLVSCHIKPALVQALIKTQRAMEESLAEISMAQIVSDVNQP